MARSSPATARMRPTTTRRPAAPRAKKSENAFHSSRSSIAAMHRSPLLENQCARWLRRTLTRIKLPAESPATEPPSPAAHRALRLRGVVQAKTCLLYTSDAADEED